MICAWKELLAVLPVRIRAGVDRLGKEQGQEIRLRLGKLPQVVTAREIEALEGAVTGEELAFCINAASSYSPWSAATLSQGFLTAAGGHRIGVCGEAVLRDGQMTGISRITSVCVRIARDFPGIAVGKSLMTGSVLVIGPPGSGKTTFLRDLIRQRSVTSAVSVVDERGELFPVCGNFDTGKHTDVLTGCGKAQGMERVLRVMGPEVLAVDEITGEADCDALYRAGWCGVQLLATCHAASRRDLNTRAVYQPLLRHGLFDTLVILRRDKTWTAERMNP